MAETLLVPASELDCPVCFSCLFEPLTLPECGHNICRQCLHRSLIIKKHCPVCREPTSVDALSHPTNCLLANLASKYNAGVYLERQKEVRLERAARKRRLPVFISRNVYLPHTCTNLHIFEAKYRVLVNRAISTDRLFVMALVDTSGRNPCLEIASEFKIEHCTNLPDGRSLIRCRGIRRVRLSKILTKDNTFGLQTAEIDEMIDDEPLTALGDALTTEERQLRDDHCRERMVSILSSVREEFCPAVGKSLRELQEAYGQVPNDPDGFTFWLGGCLPQASEVHGPCNRAGELQLACLRARSLEQRLEICELLAPECTRLCRRRRAFQLFVIFAIIVLACLYEVRLWYSPDAL